MSSIKRNLQKGFTLIELIIVVVILGVLAIVVASQFGGGASAGAKAQALYQASNKLSSNWELLTQATGTGRTVTGNQMYNIGETSITVLQKGCGAVGNNYTVQCQNSGIKALSDVVQQKDMCFAVLNYCVDVVGTGAVTFAKVPDEIVLMLVQKYGSGVATLAASDTTNLVIQYSADTGGGARNITIFH